MNILKDQLLELRRKKEALEKERIAYYSNPVICKWPPCRGVVPFLSWKMRDAEYCSNWCGAQFSAAQRRGVPRRVALWLVLGLLARSVIAQTVFPLSTNRFTNPAAPVRLQSILAPCPECGQKDHHLMEVHAWESWDWIQYRIEHAGVVATNYLRKPVASWFSTNITPIGGRIQPGWPAAPAIPGSPQRPIIATNGVPDILKSITPVAKPLVKRIASTNNPIKINLSVQVSAGMQLTNGCFSWQASMGNPFVVERTYDFRGWVPVATQAVTTTFSIIVDSAATNKCGFYRLRGI